MSSRLTPAATAASKFVPQPGLFAQLLASERITVVVHPSATTAMFAPKQRILTIPNYAGFGGDAWMLFIAHEVGHAKFTPADAFDLPSVRALMGLYGQAAQTVLNIIEDVRIERLIQQEYAGLVGIMARGYHALLARDFFAVGDAGVTPEVWTGFGPLDRLNLFAKVGGLLHGRTLTDAQEADWYRRARLAQTFDEVVTLSAEILGILSQPGQSGLPQGQPQDQQGESGQGQDQQGESGQGQEGQDQQSQQGQTAANAATDRGDEQTDGDGQSDASTEESGDEGDDQPSQGQSQGDSSDQSTTRESSMDGADAGQGGGAQSQNLTPEQKLTSKTVAGAAKSVQQEVWHGAKSLMLPLSTDYLHGGDLSLPEMLQYWLATPEDRAVLRQIVQTTKREAQPVLAAMVNKFRAYQSAWQTKREEVSRTGALDMAKLANYKLTDDIFLRRTDVPTAQNHGLVLTIDWSGSMNDQLPTVLWQVLHLVWVAEQMRIPCLVQAFSDAGLPREKDQSSVITQARRDARISDRGYYQGWTSRGHLITLYRSDAPIDQRQDGESLLAAMLLKFAGIGHLSSSRFYGSSVCVALPTSLSEYKTWNNGNDLRALPKAANPLVDRLLAVLSPRQDGAEVIERLIRHPYGDTSGTPLYHAILAAGNVVRDFRAKHRVEQCVSVFLTDGEDGGGVSLADPRTTPDVPHLGGGHDSVKDLTLLDPRSGKTFTAEGANTMLTALWSYHRQVTGASVVVIDLSNSPSSSYARVLGKTDIAKIAPAFGQDTVVYGRRRGAGRPPKQVKQTKRNVVLPSASGDFAETGLMVVDRRNVPALGPDAYLVSHPDWWVDGNADGGFMSRMATKVTHGILADDATTADGWDDEDEESFAPVSKVTLNKAITEQAAGVAMRRFADLLMPYLATGRDDATVL